MFVAFQMHIYVRAGLCDFTALILHTKHVRDEQNILSLLFNCLLCLGDMFHFGSPNCVQVYETQQNQKRNRPRKLNEILLKRTLKQKTRKTTVF